MTARKQGGFTVVELLAVMALTLVLLGLGAMGVRHYWLVQSLDGAKSSLVSEMRAQQQRSASKSYPYVQGVWFVPGSTRWGTVELDARTNACTKTSERKLDGGVRVASASFTAIDLQTPACRTAVASTSAQIAFFYPGGTATGGTVTLSSAQTTGSKTLTVSRLTGRVTE